MSWDFVGERVYVGMGSNSADRENQLIAARARLDQMEGVSLLRCSSLYDSAPIGPEQPRYLNAVVELDCELRPLDLLAGLHRIEWLQGRVRAERWGPRALDLDILLWEDRAIQDSGITVPHPELHLRRFALDPLEELIPVVRHPILNESIRELSRRVADQDVVKWRSDRWTTVVSTRDAHRS